MRERAQAVGGTLQSGRDPTGTWVVEADLPLRGTR
jgi:signal transduction histidine kinase